MPSGLHSPNSFDRSISNRRGVWLDLIIKIFNGNSCIKCNSVGPDQTPRSAASDLGLHCQCPCYGTLGLNGLTSIGTFFRQKP